MLLEQSYDKVVLTHEEIQTALKALIEAKLNRCVRGDVSVDSAAVADDRSFGKLDSKCKLSLRSSGYAWLETAELVCTKDV